MGCSDWIFLFGKELDDDLLREDRFVRLEQHEPWVVQEVRLPRPAGPLLHQLQRYILQRI